MSPTGPIIMTGQSKMVISFHYPSLRSPQALSLAQVEFHTLLEACTSFKIVCAHLHKAKGNLHQSISSVLRGDPAKIFLTSKFSYLLVSIPTHKTKTRTANRWETTNSKAPGPIIMMANQNREPSQNIFITLFSDRCQALLFIYQPQHRLQKCRAKTVLLSRTGMF